MYTYIYMHITNKAQRFLPAYSNIVIIIKTPIGHPLSVLYKQFDKRVIFLDILYLLSSE